MPSVVSGKLGATGSEAKRVFGSTFVGLITLLLASSAALLVGSGLLVAAFTVIFLVAAPFKLHDMLAR